MFFAVQSETESHSAQQTTRSSGFNLTLHSTQHSPQDSVSLCTAHNTVLRTQSHSAQHTTQSSGLILTLHSTQHSPQDSVSLCTAYVVINTVEWFRQFLITVVFLLSKKSPCRWPRDCPKHVGDDNTIKLKLVCWSFMRFLYCWSFMRFLHVINARNTELINAKQYAFT